MSEYVLPKEDAVGLPKQPTFREIVSTPLPPDEREELEALYSDQYDQLMVQAKRAETDDKFREQLIITGKYPVRKTRYDVEDDPQLENRGEFIRGMVERHVYLNLLNHPIILESYRIIQSEDPFRSIQKDIPLFDEQIEAMIAGHPLDFGTNMEGEIYDDEFTESANKLFAQGGHFSWLTKDLLTTSEFASSSSDIVSGKSLATLAELGTPQFISYDAEWSDLGAQTMLARDAMEEMEGDPAIANHPDRDFIIQRGQKCIGATLKANPQDAVHRVGALLEEGVSLYRIYTPRSEIVKTVDTVKALRDAYGNNIRIIAGPVGGNIHEKAQPLSTVEYYAQKLVEAGVDALGPGRADGGNCKTGIETGAAPINLWILYTLAKMGLPVPIFIDVAGKEAIAYATGGNIMKTRTLVGGTIEQPPYGWVYQYPYRCKSMDGEASGPIKIRGGKVDPLGYPLYVEGDPDCVAMDEQSITVARRQFLYAQSTATKLIFARQPSIRAVQREPNPVIWNMSANASRAVTPYAVQKK